MFSFHLTLLIFCSSNALRANLLGIIFCTVYRSSSDATIVNGLKIKTEEKFEDKSIST